MIMNTNFFLKVLRNSVKMQVNTLKMHNLPLAVTLAPKKVDSSNFEFKDGNLKRMPQKPVLKWTDLKKGRTVLI